jgi:hypothetical protein
MNAQVGLGEQNGSFSFWNTGNSPDCHPVDRIDELAYY